MTGKIAIIAIASMIGILVLILGISIIGTYNKEVTLRTLIETKQKDNKNEFDNMFKKIAQSVQVTIEQKNALIEIFNGYAEKRTPVEDNAPIMKWVQESVPNVDVSVYKNLQNIIISSRDSFTMRQKELLDFSREHTQLLRTFPSNIILSMFNRKVIDVTIVTSTNTENVFKAGKDDSVELFKK